MLHTRPRAFTLIELLVVIGIIALLISILVPALSSAKASANKTACQARLRGLTLTTLEYLAKNDNAFPINGLLFPKAGVPDMYADNPLFTSAQVADSTHWRPEFGVLWTEFNGSPLTGAAPFPPLDNAAAKNYICPADDLARTDPKALTMSTTPTSSTIKVGPGTGGYWSYSLNVTLNSLGKMRDDFAHALPWQDPMKAGNIRSPSAFIIFAEEDDHSRFNDEVFQPPAMAADLLTNRHQNGGNYALADGHVEWSDQKTFNSQAANSPITPMFFPDQGDFLH